MATLASAVLQLLSVLYGAVVRLRSWCFDRGVTARYTSSIPVISIGNLTAGGNGKTPLTMALATELRARALSPVVLTRGYGGNIRGPRLLTGSERPSETGDEPLLMARAGFRVVISRSRVDGARMIERERLGDVIILDDGFQHRALNRSLDILAIDVSSPEAIERFLAGRLLPAGRFREPRDSGLARAQMVVLTDRGFRRIPQREQDSRVLALLPRSLQIYRSAVELREISNSKGERLSAPAAVVAFCAIANPDPFFSTLEEAGFTVLDRVTFPDHHNFSVHELRALRDRFLGAPLVCTEKDLVKLDDPEVFAARISTRISPLDAFSVQVLRAIKVAPASGV